jgi:hypothetical protein
MAEQNFVCKSEFKEFERKNDKVHNDLMIVVKKLEPLADPALILTLKESAELSNATKRFTNNLTSKAKKYTIWIALIASCLLLFKQFRDFVLEILIKFK